MLPFCFWSSERSRAVFILQKKKKKRSKKLFRWGKQLLHTRFSFNSHFFPQSICAICSTGGMFTFLNGKAHIGIYITSVWISVNVISMQFKDDA